MVMTKPKQVTLYSFWVGVLFLICGCGTPPVTHQPVIAEAQNSPKPHLAKESINKNDSMPTGIFGENSEGAAEAWRRLVINRRYRVARASDFLIPEVAMRERGYDISRAVKFAYVGEDINGDGLYRDRAFIVIDTARGDAERFGLVIFNELESGKTVPDPHWLYRDKDLSRTVMLWVSGELTLQKYNNDGTYSLCRVKWNQHRQEYSCD